MWYKGKNKKNIFIKFLERTLQRNNNMNALITDRTQNNNNYITVACTLLYWARLHTDFIHGSNLNIIEYDNLTEYVRTDVLATPLTDTLTNTADLLAPHTANC